MGKLTLKVKMNQDKVMTGELKATEVPSIGHHLFATGNASKGGIKVVFSDQSELVRKDGTKTLLNQGNMSFIDVEIQEWPPSSKVKIAGGQKTSADSWHRRLGHTNVQNMEN